MELFATGSNVLLIFIGFGILIFVHELGHFAAAKWAGIRTEGFAIGFGPTVVSWRLGIGPCIGSTNDKVLARLGRPAIRCSTEELAEAGIGETEYTLRLLPLGGFVRMLGQDDTDPSATSADPRSFNSKSIGKRMVVISAGIVMNLILAVVFFLAAFLVGVKFNAPIVGSVVPNSVADRGGIRPGDRILSIDETPTETFADIQIAFAMSNPGSSLDVELSDSGTGSVRTLSITPEKDERTGLLGVGITPGSSSTLASGPEVDEMVMNELERSGLAERGIRPGWTITGIGGAAVGTWDQWAAVVDGADGAGLDVTWRSPEGDTVTAPMSAMPKLAILRYPGPMPETVPNYEEGLIGLTPLVRIEEVTPGGPNAGTLQKGDIVLQVGDTIGPRSAVFRQRVQEAAGGSIRMLVLRDGARTEVEATVSQAGQVGVLIVPARSVPLIARPFLETGSPLVGESPSPTPVATAGLLPLTRILGVDDRPVTDWSSLRRALKDATRQGVGGDTAVQVTLEIENPTPGRERQQVTIELGAEEIDALHALGWTPPLGSRYFDFLWTTLSANGNPLTAVEMGFKETKKVVILTYLTIFRLAQGSVGVEQLRGPVGIVHLGSRVADRGFMYLVFFLAMISVNLAVLNFLPLPIVDGGLFLYLVYEKIKGRPPSIGFQNVAALIGIVLIGTIFIITFFNDVMRLIG